MRLWGLYEVCGDVAHHCWHHPHLLRWRQKLLMESDRRDAKEFVMENFLSPWTGLVIAILIALALLRQFGQLHPLTILALLAYLLLVALVPMFMVPFGLIVLLVIIFKYPSIVRF